MSSPYRFGSALRAAWWTYLVLLILPFMVLTVVMLSHLRSGMTQRPSHDGDTWFLLAVAYLVVGIPAALFYRRHLCVAYSRGETVAPRRYLVGMLTVWLTLEVGIILPVVGCYMTESFLPMLFPAIVAFVVFITQSPTGRMMISGVGDSDDPEIYEEPH